MGSPRKFLSGPLCAIAWLGACSNALDFASLSEGRVDAGAGVQDEAMPRGEPDEFGSVSIESADIDRIVSDEGLDGGVDRESLDGSAHAPLDADVRVAADGGGADDAGRAHDGGGDDDGRGFDASGREVDRAASAPPLLRPSERAAPIAADALAARQAGSRG